MEDATLKQMRSLAAVVRHESIAGAARELHLTPQAVGQQIQLLERAAGVTLLTRTKSGIRPSEAGRRVVEAARNIDLELAACRRDVGDLVAGRKGRVTIAVVSTAKYFAPYLVAAFQHTNPNISVELTIGNRGDILDLLNDAELDVFIMGRPPQDIPLVAHVIGPHPHVMVCQPDHHLASKPTVSWFDLADEPFLMREPSSGTRRTIDTLLTKAGIAPSIAMEIATNETIKQAVMAGLGIAFLSAHTVAAELADGRIAILNVEGLPVVRHWLAVRHEHLPLSPAASLVWDFLVKEGANYLPSTPF